MLLYAAPVRISQSKVKDFTALCSVFSKALLHRAHLHTCDPTDPPHLTSQLAFPEEIGWESLWATLLRVYVPYAVRS